MSGNLLLEISDNNYIPIASFQVSIVDSNDKYCHFSGNIILNQDHVPRQLVELLDLQCKLVSENLFHAADGVGTDIAKYNIIIDKSRQEIQELYVESGKGDFKVYI